jgi:hypothetical protein
MVVRARASGQWLLAALAVVGLACSGGGGPKTYPVQGKVVAPGGKPWAGGRITFQAVSDPGLLAAGEIQPDGSFLLVTHYLVDGQPKTKAGAVAGAHAVTVEVSGAADRDGGKGPAVLLPKKYQIEAGENSLVVEARRPAGP